MRHMLTLLITTLLTITTLTHATPSLGRYVILSGDNSQACLNVAEVEVYDTNHVNVARAASVAVTQSDFWDTSSFPASNLVDGNVNTFAHTSCRPVAQSGVPVFGGLILPNTTTSVAAVQFAWMAIDLGADVNITSIVVQNRLDPCCTFRLGQGVHVLIFNSKQLATPAFVSNALTTNLTQTMNVPSPIIIIPTLTPTTYPSSYPSSYPTSYPTSNPTSYPTPSYHSSTGAWYPTSSPSSQPDSGTFWPWSTPTGSLPAAVYSPYLNPSVNDVVNHIIWQTDGMNIISMNRSASVPYGGILRDSGTTSQHSYYYATFTNYYDALSFFNSMSNTRIWVSNGYTQRQFVMSSTTLLMLRYSYLWSTYRIPSVSSPTAQWMSNVYYLTARSNMGEFRMITYTDFTQAQNAYLEVVREYTTNSSEKQWSTVKLYSAGYANNLFTSCRGSELEHLGAFQWLELPQSAYRYYTNGYYYMLVSWRARSGVRLERLQSYPNYQAATVATSWARWYTTSYDTFYDQATVVMYSNKILYPVGTLDVAYSQQLRQDYWWVSDMSAPTNYPSSYPTPYPIIDPISTSWSDLKYSQKAFIIAYPSALVAAAVIILIITGCCLKRHRTSTRIPPATLTLVNNKLYPRLTRLVVIFSITSLTMLIISISMKRFSNIDIKYGNMVLSVWAKYGPFQVFQTTPYLAWLPVLWNARVMSPIAGIAMIISMCASAGTILTMAITKKRGGTLVRPVFLSILAFLSSLLAILVFIPVHVRVFDHDNDYAVLRPYRGTSYNYYYSLERYIGTSYILLCVATGVQLINMIMMAIIMHYQENGTLSLNAPQQQNSTDGLQLVEHSSPYFYRDVPAPVTASAPAPAPVPASAPAAFIYGVPASGPPPAFTFTHYQPSSRGYVYSAPMYHPPRPEPLHQPIIASAAYPAAAPAPGPAPGTATATAPGPASAGYPSLPTAEVPSSGPTTAYQRLL